MESSQPGWKVLQNSKQHNSRSPHRTPDLTPWLSFTVPWVHQAMGPFWEGARCACKASREQGVPHTCPHLCQPEA